MNKYMIFYSKEHSKAVEFLNADDDASLLRKLGNRKVLDKVLNIYQVRQLKFDIAYYQDPE